MTGIAIALLGAAVVVAVPLWLILSELRDLTKMLSKLQQEKAERP